MFRSSIWIYKMEVINYPSSIKKQDYAGELNQITICKKNSLKKPFIKLLSGKNPPETNSICTWISYV